MSDNLIELTSQELITKHRELNKNSGAKAHLLSREDKRAKLDLKDEIAGRARNGCETCVSYMQEHGNTIGVQNDQGQLAASQLDVDDATVVTLGERRLNETQSLGEVVNRIVDKVTAVRS